MDRFKAARRHLAFLAVGYFAIGMTLVFQPSRYENTPSYANLLHVVSASGWGFLYVGCAVLMGVVYVCPRAKLFATVTHIIVLGLTAFWLSAFVYRWLSDGGTTIVNVVSWSAYGYLAVRSMLLIVGDELDGESYSDGG